MQNKKEKKLRVLILEDNPADAELIEHELEKAGIVFTSERVETRKSFLKALESFKPDLILADFKLPNFDALSALKLARERNSLIPFIIVTGSISEDVAVTCIKQGADDYLLKDRLARLGEAVRNALEKRKLQAEQAEAEEALRNSENKFSKAFRASPDALVISRLADGLIIEANDSWDRLFGYNREEVIGRNSLEMGLFANPADRQKIVAQFQEQTFVRDFEVKIKCKSGEVRHVTLSVEAIEIDSESCLLTNIHDTTERRRAEENIREARDFLDQIINAVGDPIFVKDSQHRIILANDAECDLIGRERQEIIGKTDYDFFPKKQVDHFWQRDDQVLKTGKESINEEQITDAEKSVHTIVTKKTRYTDHEGNRNIVGVIRDITERKRVEERLAESERKYRELVENANSIILHWTNDGRITFLNEFGQRFFGFSAEEIIGRNVTGTIVPTTDNSGRDLRQLMEQIRANPGAFEHNVNENMRHNGERVWIDWTNRIVQDAKGRVIEILSVGTDITDRKRAEKELHESEERFRSLYENTTIGLYRTTPDGRILMANPALLRMLGYEMLSDLIHRDLEKEGFVTRHERQNFKRMLETRGQVIGFESGWKRKDGSTIFIRESARAVKGEDGTTRYYEGTAEDITEHKKNEDLLRQSEERYRSLFEESKDVIYSTRLDGTWLGINPAGVELFGYPSREEMLAGNIFELYVDPDERKKLVEEMIRSDFVKDYPLHMKKKDGRKLEIIVTAKAVRNKQGEVTGFRGIMHDVTEARKLEQQLIQSQKMEAIGRLAGGIAHDFNNLLTVISGYGELVLNKMEEGIQKENVQSIIHAARKAAGLTAQILSFSRKQIVHPEDIDLSKVVREFEKMIGRILGEDIELRVDLADDLALVNVDVSQFEQVVLNIVVNARDAMTKGGKLVIETRNFFMDDDFLQEHPETKNGAYVRMSVTDNGAGMAAGVQEHIFEPFYTTKKLGEGTGLGLSTVYGIVKQASGHIFAESEEGKGTTFRIFFPSISAGRDRRRSPRAISAGDSLPRGQETVLVVEDEAGILELIAIVLGDLGYTVLDASNYEEAKTEAQGCGGKIDLMISDIVLPGIGGPQLFEEMKKIVPGIRIVFMSGYGDDRISREETGVFDALFLSKPFSPQALAKIVRQALDGGA